MLSNFQNFFVAVALMAFAAQASAHEGVKVECSDKHLNAIKADLQSLPESEAARTARRELALAEDARAKSDLEACGAHLHSAVEALEK